MLVKIVIVRKYSACLAEKETNIDEQLLYTPSIANCNYRPSYNSKINWTFKLKCYDALFVNFIFDYCSLNHERAIQCTNESITTFMLMFHWILTSLDNKLRDINNDLQQKITHRNTHIHVHCDLVIKIYCICFCIFNQEFKSGATASSSYGREISSLGNK